MCPFRTSDAEVVRRLHELEEHLSAYEQLTEELCVLSFHDARPRGVSGRWFQAKDEWTAAEMLQNLEVRQGCLHFFADYVRGRCVKTTVEVSSDGEVVVDTVNPGQAAIRWIDRLRGRKPLAAVMDDR